jgi:hypothetical protein
LGLSEAAAGGDKGSDAGGMPLRAGQLRTAGCMNGLGGGAAWPPDLRAGNDASYARCRNNKQRRLTRQPTPESDDCGSAGAPCRPSRRATGLVSEYRARGPRTVREYDTRPVRYWARRASQVFPRSAAPVTYSRTLRLTHAHSGCTRSGRYTATLDPFRARRLALVVCTA